MRKPAVLVVHCLWFTMLMYGMELRKPRHLLKLQLAATVAAKAKAKAAVESSVATSAAASVAKPAAARKSLPAKRSLPQNNVPDNAVDDFLRS